MKTSLPPPVLIPIVDLRPNGARRLHLVVHFPLSLALTLRLRLRVIRILKQGMQDRLYDLVLELRVVLLYEREDVRWENVWDDLQDLRDVHVGRDLFVLAGLSVGRCLWGRIVLYNLRCSYSDGNWWLHEYRRWSWYC